ncbi:hypothetical protein [Streptomyces sp. NPDC020747]|uniref:hypothetical protein n=1 Tax=Streptomyces sp. NPDC020747 TaxID=3365086 RepID=UPI003797CA65
MVLSLRRKAAGPDLRQRNGIHPHPRADGGEGADPTHRVRVGYRNTGPAETGEIRTVFIAPPGTEVIRAPYDPETEEEMDDNGTVTCALPEEDGSGSVGSWAVGTGIAALADSALLVAGHRRRKAYRSGPTPTPWWLTRFERGCDRTEGLRSPWQRGHELAGEPVHVRVESVLGFGEDL